MKNSLPALVDELDVLDRRIGHARHSEGYAVSSSAISDKIPAAIRQGVWQALSTLPQRAGLTLPEYREQTFAGVRALARAWGGECLSQCYEGFKVPFLFRCATGHHFEMLVHGLRLGHWCSDCFYDRRIIYSLADARAIAAERGGRCLSRRYRSVQEKLRWRCGSGHTWEASLEHVVRGEWCRTCHFESIKPRQQTLERAAAERGGRCLSAYVDKETPVQWQCAQGHTWLAPWSRVSSGQWCHLCAVKARTRTIEQMQALARSRGGECLSTVYPGPHGKIEWLCEKGHAWHATVNSVWRGSWCPECAWERRRHARQKRRGKGSVPILI
ncbi:zinc-ribbon domain-containing protein [Paraburkholderia acidiphila]|uniref:Treble clef zinc finger domain-containing protein n=1 Tax=Paraburkholderia acidiphila TaxID=2571747 RepID=A0A7Z2GBM5_9BURK|nr:zinc-ribbon domain-containing protein [Paraburkholderia acidiphila]QGZ58796.1 hypothetical protein FAZ97_28000 [Paraburkholderia acidiphila]